ncbi:PACE efflux transporter [Achromobacter aloeverae]
MQGIKRRIVYVAIYEAIAIAVTTLGLSVFSDKSATHAGIAAVASTTVAIVWNLVFNYLFERWEARQTTKGRSLRRRVAHAIGFEGGLVVVLVPLFAWWMGISLLSAFVLDLGLIVFFLLYTFVYNLCFDKIFGLPDSARSPQS